jgi:hypothetical protein
MRHNLCENDVNNVPEWRISQGVFVKPQEETKELDPGSRPG